MGKFFSYEKRKALEKQYKSSIRKVKVDKKSAEKIFKIIRKHGEGIMDNNLTYGITGSRTENLIERIEDYIKYVSITEKTTEVNKSE